MKALQSLAGVAVTITALSACGSGSDEEYSYGNPDDLVTDAGDAQRIWQNAYENAPDDLRTAAKAKGDLACDLPEFADTRAGHPANLKVPRYTYNTFAKPEEAYAFYRLAAEAQGGTTTVSDNLPMLVDLAIVTANGTRCRVVAQGQAVVGDTNITVTLES